MVMYLYNDLQLFFLGKDILSAVCEFCTNNYLYINLQY